MTRLTLVLLTAGLGMVMTTIGGAGAQKTSPGLGPWRCTATVEGIPESPVGLGIVSDGKGDYVDGQSGVYCLIYLPAPYSAGSNASNFMLYGMTGNKNRGRNLFYPAQDGSLDTPPRAGFADVWGGRLTIFGLATLAVGQTVSLTALSYSGSAGQFRADGGEYGPVVSPRPEVAYVTAARPEPCRWDISLDPEREGSNMSRWTGTRLDQYAGVFRMPFRVMVRVQDGSLAGGANDTTPYTCGGWPGI